MKAAVIFMFRAIGIGIAAILIAGALVWVVQSIGDRVQRARDAKADNAAAARLPYAISAPLTTRDADGAQTSIVWTINRNTGAIRLCSASLDASTPVIFCSTDQNGN